LKTRGAFSPKPLRQRYKVQTAGHSGCKGSNRSRSDT
jgi:hypothetical protein